MKNKININNIVFVLASIIVVFSALSFLASYKIVNAQSYSSYNNYSGSVNPANLPTGTFPSQRPLSYYGMTAGSALQPANAVPTNDINNVPARQYINGSYSNSPVYYSNTNNSQIAESVTSLTGTSGSSPDSVSSGAVACAAANCVYQGGVYNGSSQSAGLYKGTTYTGKTFSSNNTYTGGLYSGQSYSGSTYSGGSYSGNTYSGGSYVGTSYGGSSQVATVVSAGTPQVLGASIQVCQPYLNSYLGLGRNNDPEEVKKLQTFLNQYEGENLAVTGVFDQATFDAVKRFQDKYAKDILQDSWGLSCNTGYVYITTLTKINDIVCSTNTDFTQISLPNPRPVFFCDANGSVSRTPVINPATGLPIRCLIPTGSATTTSSSQPVTVSQTPSAASSSQVSILAKAKNAWRKILGQ